MGGAAVPFSTRINDANLKETYILALENLQDLGMNVTEIEPLGSFAKKGPQGTYGDLDLAVPFSVIEDYLGVPIEDIMDLEKVGPVLAKKFEEEGYFARWLPGVRVLSFGSPIVNIDGLQDEAWAQVDLMPTDDMSYSRWAYDSPDYGKSRWKGVHRNLLLESIAAVVFRKIHETAEIDGKEIPVVWEQFSLGPERGLYRKVLSRKGKRGLLKTPKTIEREYFDFSRNQKEIVKILLGEGFVPEDFKSFENIWDVISDPNWEHYHLLDKIKEVYRQKLGPREIPDPVQETYSKR